jgi:hypothetical protein
MRPIRLTGVTGNSQAVPLDVYTIGTANAIIESGTATTQQIQYTLDDPFTIAAGSLVWTNTATPGLNAAVAIPSGARAIRGTNMIPADTLVVSQQGIR